MAEILYGLRVKISYDNTDHVDSFLAVDGKHSGFDLKEENGRNDFFKYVKKIIEPKNKIKQMTVRMDVERECVLHASDVINLF